MNKLLKKEKGFTIIEVVLVLAIAALIFLVVFLALPALQRSQRDTQRKNDVGRMVSQLTNYGSNHNGVLPKTDAGLEAFVTGYLRKSVGDSTDKFTDPQSGSNYDVQLKVVGTTLRDTATPKTVFYYTDARCKDDDTVGGGTGERQVAVVVGLEGGGTYCQEN